MIPGPGSPLPSELPARWRGLAQYASLEYGESRPDWLVRDLVPAALQVKSVHAPRTRRLSDGIVYVARAIGSFFF